MDPNCSTATSPKKPLAQPQDPKKSEESESPPPPVRSFVAAPEAPFSHGAPGTAQIFAWPSSEADAKPPRRFDGGSWEAAGKRLGVAQK